MDYEKWFSARLMQLRMEKGVSAYAMSLALGQHRDYINKIENRRFLPSMSVFFCICKYLEIAPQEFFNTGLESPKCAKEIAEAACKLSAKQAKHVLQIMQDMTDKQ